jgi:hypothetical protein
MLEKIVLFVSEKLLEKAAPIAWRYAKRFFPKKVPGIMTFYKPPFSA